LPQRIVIAGLDPAIHQAEATPFFERLCGEEKRRRSVHGDGRA
jgi:hypothetical protein